MVAITTLLGLSWVYVALLIAQNFVLLEAPKSKTSVSAWGKPVGGLQAGIRCEDVPEPVEGGRGIPFEIVVRNVSDRRLPLTRMEGMWYSGDNRDGVVELGPGSIGGKPVAVTDNLEPGQEIVLGRAVLGLEGSKSSDKAMRELPAGKYQVGSEDVLISLTKFPPANQLPANYRHVQLRTGYLDLELTEVRKK